MADGEPEDWPSQPEQLRCLDRSLRCAVCYDLYTGPVVLPCSHSFCSRCIRNSFNVRVKDGQMPVCPSCRKPCDQADLRPSTHLREAAAAWQAVRGLLLSHHLQALQPQTQHKQQAQQQQPPQLQQQQQQQQAADPPGGRRQQQSSGKRSRSAAAEHTAAAGKRRLTASAAAARQQQDCITISESSQSEEAQQQGDDRGPGQFSSSSADAAGADSGCAALDAADAADISWSDDELHEQQQQQQQRTTRGTGRNSRTRQQRRSTTPSTAVTQQQQQQQQQQRSVADAAAASDSGGAGEGSAGLDSISSEGGAAAACDDPSDPDFEPPDEVDQVHAGSAGGGVPANKRQKQQACETAHCSGKENRAGSKQQQQLQPGYVACPICSMSVREAFINSHVDTCLEKAGGVAAVAPPPSSSSKPRQQQQHHHQQQNGRPPPAAAAGAGGGGGAAVSSGGGVSMLSRLGRGKGVPGQRVGGTPLDAPPKLCFELLKERELKAKLTGLGLSNEGNKKVCADRYTAFRAYVLSLKDSSSNLSLQQAAAEFTKQQRRISRAAARPSLAAAAAAGVSNSGAGGLVAAGAGAVADEVAAGVDNSFAALIHETKLRITKQKETTQQQQQGTAGALQGSAQGGSSGEQQQQQQQQGLDQAASPLLGQPADIDMAQDQQQLLLLPGEGQQKVSQQLQEQEDGRLAALCESESEGGEGGLLLPGPDHQEVLTQ